MAAKKKSSVGSTVKKAATYAKTVARELRDIPTAVGAPKRMPTSKRKTQTYKGEDGKKYQITQRVMKSNAGSGIKAQLKEAAAAITSGQKGTSVGHRAASGTIKPRKGRGSKKGK